MPPLAAGNRERREHAEKEYRHHDPEGDRVAPLLGLTACECVRSEDARGDDGPDRSADRPHDRVHACGDARLSGGNRLDDQIRHRRECEADPDADQHRGDVDLPARSRDREHDEGESGDGRPQHH